VGLCIHLAGSHHSPDWHYRRATKNDQKAIKGLMLLDGVGEIPTRKLKSRSVK